MPTLTIQYVYFGASGAHTRQPRATTSYGGFTPIPGYNGAGVETLMSGTAFQPLLAPPTITVGDLVLNFAFVNVCGCTEGGLTSFAPGTMPTGTVGSNPILVNYVYLPAGGGPGGDPGAVIDAYNETSGTLVDNDFVSVSPDPGGTLTTEANVNGWVSTADSGYTIAADHPNIGAYMADPTNLVFDQWVDLQTATPPASLVNGANLTPGQNVTVYALAFYKVPVAPKYHKEVKEFLLEKPRYGKDYEKEYPGSPETPKVPNEGIKGLKDSSEGYGGYGGVDPALAGQMSDLNARVSQLEANAAQQGTAFIKPQDRPAVNKPQT